MKKVIKDNLKIIMIIIITSIITSSITGVFAYSYAAKDIEYTPRDTSWQVTNVEDAIKDLKNSQGGSSDNYSTDEKVVGTWIDGKPLYQRTIKYTSYGTFSIASLNAEFIICKNAALRYDNKFSIEPYYTNQNDWWNYYIENTQVIIRGSSNINRINYIYLTFIYTKTTD